MSHKRSPEESEPAIQCRWCGRLTRTSESWESWLPAVPGVLCHDYGFCSLDCLYCHCQHWAPRYAVLLQAIEQRAGKRILCKTVPKYQAPRSMETTVRSLAESRADEVDIDDEGQFSGLLGAPDP